MPQPFFTIGIPTYNRHGLLRKTIESVLAQNFTDFEVIVGNDFTDETLAGELLGVTDPRIRFVNHPVNLREVGNMNVLLAMAHGRYFTWLFDDDLYEPGFLLAAHTTLNETGFPPALFTSYSVIDDNHWLLDPTPASGEITQFSGPEFLHAYFSDQLKLISTCGIFNTVALTGSVGGVEELCDSAIGLYCEYLFLVRCGLFKRIVYLDAPYVVFRAHSGSWGESNTELGKYLEAGQKLLRRCVDLLRRIGPHDTFAPILIGICRIHLLTFATKSVTYETGRKQNGLSARYRAIRRFSKEAAIIRTTCITESGSWDFRSSVSFLKMQLYCYRFILGKFRVFRREASS